MAKHLSEITNSLRQLGEIQVIDWDFMALMNKDIKDLEIGRSLRRLGNRKVMDWDFQTVMPAMHKFAHQEVHLVELVKRAAHYKVMEWDFRKALPSDAPRLSGEMTEDPAATPSNEEIQAVIERLKSFVEFVTVSLIHEPERAQIRVQNVDRCVVQFKLVVSQRDVMEVIGRDGKTASAIRGLLKATALANGVHALLQIQSNDEELAQSRSECGEM